MLYAKGEFVMKHRFLRLVLPVCAVVVLSQVLRATAETNEAPNLAVVATPSALYASGDSTVTALNDGFTPRNSADGRHHTYGNWPRTDTQWVQYEWSQPISTKQIDV